VIGGDSLSCFIPMKCIVQAFFLLFFIVLFSACKDKKKENELKNEQPRISIVQQSIPTVSETLCGASFTNVLKASTGDTMIFSFLFRASNPLSQYKVDIHNNFDCHSHGKSLPWSVLKLVDLSGQEASVSDTLVVPDDAASGNYHLMIRLLDIYGLEAEPLEFNLIISNAQDQEGPQIELNTPLEHTSYRHGDSVPFSGLISDNLSLKDSRYELKFTDSNNNTYNLYEIFYPPSALLSYTIDTSYTIGPFIALGEGYFTIKAYDQANNFSTLTRSVFIVE